MSQMQPPARSTIIKSVQKAMTILSLFADRTTPLTVTEVSKTLNLNFSTTHHLLSTLLVCGYVHQDPQTRKYYLGARALQLGLSAQESFQIIECARPVLAELTRKSNESALLALHDNTEVMYVDQATSPRALSLFTKLGARAPLHCTGVGKVFLANLDRKAVRTLVGQSLRRYTSYTITRWDELEDELDKIKVTGYALDREEREHGISCVAAPVRDVSGRVCAAISVSGPAGRMLRNTDFFIKHVIKAAAELSGKMGYRTDFLQPEVTK